MGGSPAWPRTPQHENDAAIRIAHRRLSWQLPQSKEGLVRRRHRPSRFLTVCVRRQCNRAHSSWPNINLWPSIVRMPNSRMPQGLLARNWVNRAPDC